MPTTTVHDRARRSPFRPGRLLTALFGGVAAIWQALPRVESIAGPVVDGPGERSVIINGRRCVFRARVGRDD